jgi:hypothetical protein
VHPRPSLFARFRLCLLAALLACAFAPHARAQYVTYNGYLVVRAPGAKPSIINSTTTVAPVLTAPTQIMTITRAQGVITRNVLNLHTSGLAVYTLGNNTVDPVVLRGTYVTTKANNGSAIVVTLLTGNPTGTITFHIQPGATNYTALLDYTGVHGTTRQQFAGTIPPNPFNP